MPKRKFSNGSIKRANKRSKPTAKDRRDRRLGIVRVTTRGPVAQKTIAKLKYSDQFASATTPIDYVFNLNSIFDPNVTSAGHQPYGHDTYQTLYNRYRVFRCDYILTLGCSGIYRVIVGANNTQTAYTNAQLAAESPNFRTFVTTPNTPMIIRGSYNLPRLNGSTPQQYKSDDRFQAQFGADPTENLCLHVVNSEVATNASPGANLILYNITLIYHVEMFDPKELSSS